MPSPPAPSEPRLALAAGIACYTLWGFVPLLFQVLGRLGVPSWEILAHRIVWSMPAAALFVLLARQGGQVRSVLGNPRVLAWLALSSLLIATNWVVFIWAVNQGRLLETSLGYYINPLVNMAAGALLFRERIDPVGKIAIGLALAGVAVQAFALGHLPWVSLMLAFSFAGYGLVRKQVAADAQTGFLVETLIVGLIAVPYLAWLHAHGGGKFGEPATTWWLVLSGPATAIPLVLFAWSARRIPLSLMGFLQFLAPTISFGIGMAQGEPFTGPRAASFALIWCGVAVFVYGAWRRTRHLARTQTDAAPAA